MHLISKNIFYAYLKTTCMVWSGGILASYAVLACQFSDWRFITLPFDTTVVEKLNDIAKNLSFSYIAAVIFFVFSDTIPFLRKQYYVNKNLGLIRRQVQESIQRFYRYFCSTTDKDATVEIMFLQTTGYEYDEQGYYTLPQNKLYELKLLYARVSFFADQIISYGEYIENDYFEMALKIKSEEGFSALRDYSIASDSLIISNCEMMKILLFIKDNLAE